MNPGARRPFCRAMLRPFAVALAAFCAAGPAVGATLPQSQDALVLLLRDPSGGPATKVTGYLICEPAWELPVLRGLWHGELVISPTKLATGSSDANGILRFQCAEPDA